METIYELIAFFFKKEYTAMDMIDYSYIERQIWKRNTK